MAEAEMKTIPMLDLKREYEYMKADIDTAIRKCLDHQKWILGPEVSELEERIADYLGVKYAIGTSSGTDALVLALRALAIKFKGQEYFDKSDHIITTPFTFTATGDAILRAGATPVFVDIDPVTYNIDPKHVRDYLIQHSTKTVGVIPVHLYGQACEMAEIMGIAREYDLFVVEDVAQAFGATSRGERLGAIGTAGAFSFFPSKNLAGFGDGGMVSTNDDQLEALIRMLLKHGGKDKYNVDHIGYNARLDTFQAAILLAKFKYLDEFNSRRRHIAEIYSRELSGLERIIMPCTHDKTLSAMCYALGQNSHVFHQFTIRVLHGRRDLLQQHLRSAGIDSMVYYPVPLHKMRVFDGERCDTHGGLERADCSAREVLSLPIEPLMRDEEVESITEHLKRFYIMDGRSVVIGSRF